MVINGETIVFHIFYISVLHFLLRLAKDKSKIKHLKIILKYLNCGLFSYTFDQLYIDTKDSFDLTEGKSLHGIVTILAFLKLCHFSATFTLNCRRHIM